MNDTRKQVTLVRTVKGVGQQQTHAVIRQLPHDELAEVGKMFRYGSGARWLVVEVKSFD